jgi:hypothetical protein
LQELSQCLQGFVVYEILFNIIYHLQELSQY